MYSKLVVILSFAIFAIFAVVCADDCSKKFKQDDSHVNASQTCTKTLQITEKDMPQDEAEFTKNFEDKVS